MERFQHIVVGIDEGGFADSAIVTGLHLSRLLHAPLEIVHAVRTRAERPWLASDKLLEHLEKDVIHEARKSRANQLWKLLQPFATTHQEIESMLHITPGRPSIVLSKHVADREGAMVVLGGHRHRRFFDAGTARELMVRPLCPLWVQGSQPWSEIRRILVLLDLSPGSAPILSLAKDLAAASHAVITVLHCFEPPTYSYVGEEHVHAIHTKLEESAREEFAEFMAREQTGDIPIEARLETGGLAETALSLASESDLIVMGMHGYSAVTRVLLGNHAYRILNEAEKPVLVVPQPVVA